MVGPARTKLVIQLPSCPSRSGYVDGGAIGYETITSPSVALSVPIPVEPTSSRPVSLRPTSPDPASPKPSSPKPVSPKPTPPMPASPIPASTELTCSPYPWSTSSTISPRNGRMRPRSRITYTRLKIRGKRRRGSGFATAAKAY